ncbi:MAG: NUDIX hydrolase [Acidimicrobiia bacterium]
MTRVTGRRQKPSEEQQFLEEYDASAFPPVAVTVDVVLLTIRQGVLSVLLIRRGAPPFRGCWALPGGFVQPAEDLETAARRELAEETGVALSPLHLEQLRAYGAPERDPRMRVVSVAYLGLMPDLPRPGAGTDAADARFWPVDDLATPDGPELSFDHERIVTDGIERARSMLEATNVATSFVEAPFTIADLRRVYESVWGTALHPANFRRKVLSVPGLVIPTGEERATGRGWTALYRAGPTRELRPPMLRPGPQE